MKAKLKSLEIRHRKPGVTFTSQWQLYGDVRATIADVATVHIHCRKDTLSFLLTIRQKNCTCPSEGEYTNWRQTCILNGSQSGRCEQNCRYFRASRRTNCLGQRSCIAVCNTIVRVAICWYIPQTVAFPTEMPMSLFGEKHCIVIHPIW
jgi:hypothetical protein